MDTTVRVENLVNISEYDTNQNQSKSIDSSYAADSFPNFSRCSGL